MKSANPNPANDFRREIYQLSCSRLFWLGLAIKLICAPLFGSNLATEQFAPFVYQFVHNPFSDVYQAFIDKGIPDAFPYGPGMLLYLSWSWFPVGFFAFDPGSHFGLLLLRLPLIAADLAVCVLLMRWLGIHTNVLMLVYWLNPISLYATYVHGQLDIVPTAMLCVALYFIFARRITLGAIVFGVALATKTHLLIAAPFLFVYTYRIRQPRRAWLRFVIFSGLTALIFYSIPLSSDGFREMVFNAPQNQTVWAAFIPYGERGPLLYLAPTMLLVGLITYAGYLRVNREITLMFLGAMFVWLVALIPPQPGWFVWSLPFVAYMAAQFNRTRRIQLLAFFSAYLLYFTVGAPSEFLSAFDPILGREFGASTAALLRENLPALFSQHISSVAWTILFAATAVTGLEMYRRGVVANSIYGYRDDCFMIGIGGDSATGKHTVAQDVTSLMGPYNSIIHGDDDHKWERGDQKWHQYTHLDPRSNRLGVQYQSMSALRRGSALLRRRYEHADGRFSEPSVVDENMFLTLVGLHPFYLPSQRRLFDLKIFLHPEESVRRSWKIARDASERGYSSDQVIESIERRMPDANRYILPQMKYADIVIRHREKNNRGTTNVNLELILSSDLETTTLLDSLEQIASIKANWEPDESLTRDRLEVMGTLTADQVRELAFALIPDIDQLVVYDRWEPGDCGLVQVIILNSIGLRLGSKRGQT